MFERQQQYTGQTPLTPPTAKPSPRRPTADEWFHAVSVEPPVIEPPVIESQDRQSGSQKRPILIGIGALALLAITVISVIWTLTTTDDTSDLAKCDTWLRAQFVNHAETTASARNANAVVGAVQDQRAADCPRNAWNPLVSSITQTRYGNIEVRFATAGRTPNGQAVTMPAAGTPRWIYVAAEGQWNSVPDRDLPVLAVKPTSTSTPPPPSTAAPPTETATTVHDRQPTPTTRPTAPTATATSRAQPRAPKSGNEFSGPAAAMLEQGRELFKQQDYRAAAEAFATAQLRHGKPSQILENQTGMALRRLEDHPQDIVHFTKAIELRDNPVDRIERALSFMATRQCANALQDASRALAMQPESTDGFHTGAAAHVVLSTCNLRAGDAARAVKHAKAAIAAIEGENHPAERLTNAHITAGNAYALAKSHSRAIEHYSTAIELNDNAEAHVGRAWVHRDTSNCNAALADASAAMSLPAVSRNDYHSGAEASWIFVVCLVEAGNHATQHIENSLRLMEESDYTTSEIAERSAWVGNAFSAHGQHSDAIRYLSESIETHDTATTRVSRAVAHQKNGNCSEAINDSNQVLEMPPENWLHYRSGDNLNSWAEAHMTLALCYTAKPQPETAMQHVESALIYMHQASYTDASIGTAETLAKDLQDLNKQPGTHIQDKYRQEGRRLNASRSSRLVWTDGSNWVDGVSHNFPAVPIPDGHLLKHHLTCAQRETLYLALSRNSATFANLVWGNHPLAATLYEQNSFERECGSAMRTK